MQNGPRYLTENDINTVSLYTALTPGGGAGAWTPANTTDLSTLGQVGQTGDGRFYRYCLIGGTSTVTPGTLMIAPAAPANSTGLAIPTTQPSNTAFGNADNSKASALSKGSVSFNVTNGSTAVTADEFAGGFVDVMQTSGTNEGPVTYKVAGNSAAGAAGTITLYLNEPLNQPEALTAGTDTVDLRKNPYANVAASTTLGRPVGIVTVQVPNSSTAQYLAWVQTRGDCQGVSTDSITAFDNVAQSTADAGYVVALADDTTFVIGQALKAGVDTDPITLVLNLP